MNSLTPTRDTVVFSRSGRIDEKVAKSLHNKTVVVIGCGGGGVWFSLFAALSAPPARLMLYDGDNLEPSNLGRLPYKPGDIGHNKAETLAAFIQGLQRDIEIYAQPTFVDEAIMDDILSTINDGGENPTGRVRVIVDATDRTRIQEMIKQKIREARSSPVYSRNFAPIQYLRVGGDSGYFTVSTSVDPEYTTGIDGYINVPSDAANMAIPAAVAFYAMRDADIESVENIVLPHVSINAMFAIAKIVSEISYDFSDENFYRVWQRMLLKSAKVGNTISRALGIKIPTRRSRVNGTQEVQTGDGGEGATENGSNG